MKKIKMLMWFGLLVFIALVFAPLQTNAITYCNSSYTYALPITILENGLGDRQDWRVNVSVNLTSGNVTDGKKEFAVCDLTNSFQLSYDFQNTSYTGNKINSIDLFIKLNGIVPQNGNTTIYFLFDCDSCSDNPYNNISKMFLVNYSFATSTEISKFQNTTFFEGADTTNNVHIYNAEDGNPKGSMLINFTGAVGDFGTSFAYFNILRQSNPRMGFHSDQKLFYNWDDIFDGQIHSSVIWKNITYTPFSADANAQTYDQCQTNTALNNNSVACVSIGCNGYPSPTPCDNSSINKWNSTLINFDNTTKVNLNSTFLLSCEDYTSAMIEGCGYDNVLVWEVFNGTYSNGDISVTTANQPPIGNTITSGNSTNSICNNTFLFALNTTDPNNDTLTYYWQVSINGTANITINYSTTGYYLTEMNLTYYGNNYTYSFYANDSQYVAYPSLPLDYVTFTIANCTTPLLNQSLGQLHLKQCPSTTEAIAILFIALLLGGFLTYTAFSQRYGILGIIGGLIFIVCGAILIDCFDFIGFLTIASGIAIILASVFSVRLIK